MWLSYSVLCCCCCCCTTPSSLYLKLFRSGKCLLMTGAIGRWRRNSEKQGGECRNNNRKQQQHEDAAAAAAAAAAAPAFVPVATWPSLLPSNAPFVSCLCPSIYPGDINETFLPLQSGLIPDSFQIDLGFIRDSPGPRLRMLKIALSQRLWNARSTVARSWGLRHEDRGSCAVTPKHPFIIPICIIQLFLFNFLLLFCLEPTAAS